LETYKVERKWARKERTPINTIRHRTHRDRSISQLHAKNAVQTLVQELESRVPIPAVAILCGTAIRSSSCKEAGRIVQPLAHNLLPSLRLLNLREAFISLNCPDPTHHFARRCLEWLVNRRRGKRRQGKRRRKWGKTTVWAIPVSGWHTLQRRMQTLHMPRTTAGITEQDITVWWHVLAHHTTAFCIAGQIRHLEPIAAAALSLTVSVFSPPTPGALTHCGIF